LEIDDFKVKMIAAALKNNHSLSELKLCIFIFYSDEIYDF